MSISDLKLKVTEAVDRLRDELASLSLEIHRNPELAFEEHKAASLLTSFLEKEGFEVERNVAGMETDFRATFVSGEGGPTVAILAEYDALTGGRPRVRPQHHRNFRSRCRSSAEAGTRGFGRARKSAGAWNAG